MALFNLLLSQLLKYLRAAGAFVADYFASGKPLQLSYKLRGEAGISEGAKGRGDMQAHHLPVACHGVLAVAGLLQNHAVSKGAVIGREPMEGAEIGKPKATEIGDAEPCCPGYMPQGVGTLVAELTGVRHCPYSQGVYHNDKNAFILSHIRPQASSRASFIMSVKLF